MAARQHRRPAVPGRGLGQLRRPPAVLVLDLRCDPADLRRRRCCRRPELLLEFKGGSSFTSRQRHSDPGAIAQWSPGRAAATPPSSPSPGAAPTGRSRPARVTVPVAAEQRVQRPAERFPHPGERDARPARRPDWGSQITRRRSRPDHLPVVIVIYLAIAFEWRMALAGVVALLHDLVITIGVYALVGFEVTPGDRHRPADHPRLLAVRHRRRVRQGPGEHPGCSPRRRSTYSEAANLALNQTLIRSINTTLIALLPVAAILFVGGRPARRGHPEGPVAGAVRRHAVRHLLLDLSSPPRCWPTSRSASRRYKALRQARSALRRRPRGRPAGRGERDGPGGERLAARHGHGRAPSPWPSRASSATPAGDDEPGGTTRPAGGDGTAVAPRPAGRRARQVSGSSASPAATSAARREEEAAVARTRRHRGRSSPSRVRDVPDYPQPGVAVQGHHPAARPTREAFARRDRGAGRGRTAPVDKVVGIEARGFILAAPVAYAIRRRLRAGPQAGQAARGDARPGVRPGVRQRRPSRCTGRLRPG